MDIKRIGTYLTPQFKYKDYMMKYVFVNGLMVATYSANLALDGQLTVMRLKLIGLSVLMVVLLSHLFLFPEMFIKKTYHKYFRLYLERNFKDLSISKEVYRIQAPNLFQSLGRIFFLKDHRVAMSEEHWLPVRVPFNAPDNFEAYLLQSPDGYYYAVEKALVDAQDAQTNSDQPVAA
ncbi:MAG: hypothetical protein ACPGJV_00425 [Bacteriovoracaceae bacterium]